MKSQTITSISLKIESIGTVCAPTITSFKEHSCQKKLRKWNKDFMIKWNWIFNGAKILSIFLPTYYFCDDNWPIIFYQLGT